MTFYFYVRCLFVDNTTHCRWNNNINCKFKTTKNLPEFLSCYHPSKFMSAQGFALLSGKKHGGLTWPKGQLAYWVCLCLGRIFHFPQALDQRSSYPIKFVCVLAGFSIFHKPFNFKPTVRLPRAAASLGFFCFRWQGTGGRVRGTETMCGEWWPSARKPVPRSKFSGKEQE